MKYKLSLIIEGIDRTNTLEKYHLNIKNGRVFVSSKSDIFYIDNVK